mmetsp:Transcript_106717/g.271012  ORF Transcript_106717/g.271012 Transcript_106717/m.271012 type:complete len:323 (-) Transcript_106717:1272-2240(-)
MRRRSSIWATRPLLASKTRRSPGLPSRSSTARSSRSSSTSRRHRPRPSWRSGNFPPDGRPQILRPSCMVRSSRACSWASTCCPPRRWMVRCGASRRCGSETTPRPRTQPTSSWGRRSQEGRWSSRPEAARARRRWIPRRTIGDGIGAMTVIVTVTVTVSVATARTRVTTSVEVCATAAVGASFRTARRTTAAVPTTATGAGIEIETGIETVTENEATGTVTKIAIGRTTGGGATTATRRGGTASGRTASRGARTATESATEEATEEATEGATEEASASASASARSRSRWCCTSTRCRCLGVPRWILHRQTARSTWIRFRTRT